MGLTLNEVNGGSVCNVEAVGSVAFGLPDASLSLLAPLSSSPSVDETALIDPARFEVDIVCQLYFDSCKSLVRVDCASPSVMNHLGRWLDSSSTSTVSVQAPSSPLPWLSNMLEQPSSMVVNPPLLSVEDRDFHPVNLGVGVYGNVPCDLPREVVRYALAISLDSQSYASCSGVGLNECVHSKNASPIVSVARSNVENKDIPLAVDFSFLQNPSESLSVDDIWDGESVNSWMVPKWVASKLKSIAATIGVAFSGYE